MDEEKKTLVEETFDDLKNAIHLDEEKLLKWCEENKQIPIAERVDKITEAFKEMLRRIMDRF